MGNIPRTMTLREWIKAERLTYERFARKVGVSRHAVWKWAAGVRMPRPDTIRKIDKVTSGAVPPAAFYRTAGKADSGTPPYRRKTRCRRAHRLVRMRGGA